MSFVSDYAAHLHLNEDDYAEGATVTLSLRKNPGVPSLITFLPMFKISGSVGPGWHLILVMGHYCWIVPQWRRMAPLQL